jgi:predicted nucleic acid-binding protein
MADRFFDTSAIVKHYRNEVGTDKVDNFLGESGCRHLISDLSVVELHSVFARLCRIGEISSADFHLARGRFLADIGAGLWQVGPVSAGHFHRAQQLLAHHGLSRSLRTLDALQLATALLHPGKLDCFVCADSNLGLIAVAEGLSVVNPEMP